MSTAERLGDGPQDPPTLRMALWLLDHGYWPVPTYPLGVFIGDKKSDGKPPIGVEWGLRKKTEAELRDIWRRFPGANVGVKFGFDGGLFEIENDAGEAGEALILDLFGGEDVDTLRWMARRGNHRAFLWDDRLAKYKKAVVKLDVPGGGHIEIRIGATGPDSPKQTQSVVPPSLNSDGTQREWLAMIEPAPVPDCFFENLDRLLKVQKATLKAPKPSSKYPPTDRRQAYADEAMKRELITLATCQEGSRNDQLNTAAFSLGQFVPLGLLSEESITYQLLLTADGIGLGHAEAVATIRSGLKAGMANPRDLSNLEESPEPRRTESDSSPEPAEPEEWQPPRLYKLPPPLPFPVDVFPKFLADLCRQGAKAYQCPPDYFGTAALGIAGAAVGMSVSLTLKSDYSVPPHLYLACVGPPGTTKSPACLAMSRPVWKIDKIHRTKYEQDKSKYEDDKQAKVGGLVAPAHGHFMIDDSTQESVARIHADNPRGLILIQDELTAWVSSQNAYRNGKGSDEQFWLKTNSGTMVKVTRVGRDPLIISHPCITVLGSMTPAKLPAIMSGADDGWLDRILFAYPETVERGDWNEDVIDPTLLDSWNRVVLTLYDRQMVDPDDPRPFFIRFSREAAPIWAAWSSDHWAEVRDPDFSGSLRGPWAKMEGYCGRLALILSQIRQAYGGYHVDPEGVSVGDLGGAISLIRYFKESAKRIHAELCGRSSIIPDDAAAILKWVKGGHHREFSEAEAKKCFESRFRDNPLALADALEWLVKRHCVRPVPIERKATGRMPSRHYEVSPYLVPADEVPF